jgi:hypothetical protein
MGETENSAAHSDGGEMTDSTIKTAPKGAVLMRAFHRVKAWHCI